MSDSDLTPAQDESVRELLAAAKHTEPTPRHVVARLDETLADLEARRREERAPVVTLASHRRRHASRGLLAAAAAVVLGVGVTQVLLSLSGGESEGGATGGSASDETTSQADRSSGAEAPAAGESGAGAGQVEPAEPEAEEKSPSGGTTLDARPALVSTSPLKPQLRAAVLGRRTASFSTYPTCPVPVAGSTDQVPVTYDNTSAVLVYRPPAARRQQVDLFLCGEPDPFVSVRIRTR